MLLLLESLTSVVAQEGATLQTHEQPKSKVATEQTGTKTRPSNEDEARDRLIGAARNANVSRLRELLSQVDDVNSIDERGITPLHAAAVSTHPGAAVAIKMLLDAGAKVDANNNTWEQTPLMLAADVGDDSGKIKVLLAGGANPSARDKLGNVSMHWATRFGWWPSHIMKLEALDDGLHRDVNTANHWGWTPLMEACRTVQDDMVADLLRRTADPNMQNNDGWTPLMIAVGSSDPDVWEDWFRRDQERLRAEVASEDDIKAMLARMYAVDEFHGRFDEGDIHTSGQVGRVWTLLEYGAKPEMRAKDGTTVFTLLEGRTDPSAAAIRKLLELDVAKLKKRHEMSADK